MGYAHEYFRAVMRRPRDGMPPHQYQPDWGDKPRQNKFYPDADEFPLPEGENTVASLAEGLHPSATGGRFDIGLLAGMLRESYGYLARRLAIHNNHLDLEALPRYTYGLWSRGTASGGGLYPVSVYWVNGRSGPLTPGVHYYDTAHHSLRTLLTGDVSAEIRAALGSTDEADQTDQFLVLGIKFWQSTFKYNNFAYQPVTMDIGTLTQTWRLWAQARGLSVPVRLWFDEDRLCRLLGVHGEDEGVFAVVPLKWQDQPATTTATASAARIRVSEQERSRRTKRFELTDRVHAATTVDAKNRPHPEDLAAAAALPAGPGRRVALGKPDTLDMPVSTALRRRRSSFGRFSAQEPLRPGQLAAVMGAAATAAKMPCDVAVDSGLAKLYAFVNHVDGVEPGLYEFDPSTTELVEVDGTPQGRFLQRNYLMGNYNVEQAAAVLVATARVPAVLDALGDRGYRLANAVIGAFGQAVYTACGALGVGCGAALGFDNVSYQEQLGLADTDEAPLLMVMIGNERTAPADFRYELTREAVL